MNQDTAADTALLAELADSYGTPLYVYDLAELRRAHADLRASVPVGTQVLYSLKANPNPDVVRELLGAGARAEVCSQRELDTALAQGADAAQCLYTGPGKTAAEFDHALAAGVRRFSVDSPTDLARLGGRARSAGLPAEAVLRLNPSEYPRSAGLAMGGTPSQFGADLDWVCAEPERFRADGVELVGYHVYIGTNITDVEQLAGWFELGLNAVSRAQKALGCTVRLIDLGGGFGHPYARAGARPALPGLADRLGELLAGHLSAGDLGEPEIAFESGRYLACAAGKLLLGVQDVKTSQGVRHVIADGGINALGGMQGLRRVPPIMAGALALDAPDADEVPAAAGPAVLTGPLCTALDVLNSRAPLPDVAPGDLLVVPNVGAYGLTASLLGFLSREAPAEVAVDGGEVVSARRLQLGYGPATPRQS